jgi:hypothetical protein
VATNTEISDYGMDPEQAVMGPRPVSGAKIYGLVGAPESPDCWPVVVRPLLDIRPSYRASDMLRLAASLGNLRPVSSCADPQDMPARACLYCEHPLPVDIDDRRIITIAVLGTKSSGKTHYLASAMYLACRMQGLAGVGCVQFEPDERTAKDYHEKYFEPLFVYKRQIPGTEVDDQVRFSPLVYRVQFRNGEPCSLLFHDVSGEMFDDPKMRARYAQFIYRADGAIFLVDPEQMYRSNGYGNNPDLPQPRTYNQADLLISWLRSLNQPVPVAVTLSKSDLVSARFPDRFGRLEQQSTRSEPGWSQEMKAIAAQVEQIFQEFHAYDLLAAVRRNGNNTTLHAVAALGAAPLADGTVTEVQARRCLDPLVTLLTRIPDVIGQAHR